MMTATDAKEKTPNVRLGERAPPVSGTGEGHQRKDPDRSAPVPSTTDLRGRPPAVRARDCGEGRVGEQLVRHGAAVALAAQRAVGLGRDPLARAQRE